MASTKERLQKLNKAKEEIEAKIAKHGEILKSNDNVGMNGPLVDSDCFPRNDIDIYQVRQARQQIICLQNDYKELLNQIHVLLIQYHQEIGNNENGTPTSTEMESTIEQNSSSIKNEPSAISLIPIVKVNLVSPNSPAEDAGLCIGDFILQFGTIDSTNFNNDLNQIGKLVQNMKDQRINLKVKRNENILDLTLIPKYWSGRGLLGCNIVLPDSVDI